MNDDDTKEAVETLVYLSDLEGAAVVNVKDGHVFMFTTKMLKNLLDKAEKSKDQKAVIFVQHNKILS
jgi:hypothetical protein